MTDQLDAEIRVLMRVIAESSIEPPAFPAERIAAQRAAADADGSLGDDTSRSAVPVVDGRLGRRRSTRRWVVAVVAALFVLVVVAVPAWVFRAEESDEAIGGSELELGAGHVWPESGRSGSPAEVVSAFASEVLGWTDATVSSDPGADLTGPVVVRIQQPGVAEVVVFTIPVPSGGRVLIQVGSPAVIAAIEPGNQSLGTRVWLERVPGAQRAGVTIRLDDGRHVNLEADLTDLERGAVDASEIEPLGIQTVLVRFYDADGQVVGVSGGHGEADPDGVVYFEPASQIVETDGLTLVVQDSNNGPCLEVRTEDGMAGGCGSDFSRPLDVGFGSVGDKSFASGWAPAGTVEVVITFSSGDMLSVTALHRVQGYDVLFFLGSPLPSPEPALPIEATAYDTDGNLLATVTYSD